MQHCISTAALHHPITWVFLPPEAFSFHILPMGQAGWWEGESPTPPPPPTLWMAMTAVGQAQPEPNADTAT